MRGGQNTRGQGERVKIPLLPNSVDKRSVNNAVPQQGHDREACSRDNFKAFNHGQIK